MRDLSLRVLRPCFTSDFVVCNFMCYVFFFPCLIVWLDIVLAIILIFELKLLYFCSAPSLSVLDLTVCLFYIVWCWKKLLL